MHVRQRPESERVDWKQARHFITACVRRARYRLDDASVEDVVQDALMRLHRTVSRQPEAGGPGLMADIAKKSLIDHIRSCMRRRRLMEDGGECPLEILGRAESIERAGDRETRETLRATIVELFEEHCPECLPLALQRMEDLSWDEIAAGDSRTPAALRQVWHRGIERIRRGASAQSWKIRPARVA